jgi:tetratricopeptide (TPR) repeat protein
MVNLGIALGEAGDTARAIEVLRRAATIDPWEPLAPFNLGNIHLSRRELDQAGSLYLRTLALDPGIAVAHFRLARVWILARKYTEALRELRRGLAFDSTDAAARETAGQLAKALGRTGR